MACITGGSKGIGAACVKRFLNAGYHVVFCARDASHINRFSEQLSRDYDPTYFHGHVADVSQASDRIQLFEFIQNTYGYLDCLINNAATIYVEPLETMSVEALTHLFNVNVMGVFGCMQLAIPLMKSTGGSIVNISSLSGIKGVEKFPGFCAYTMSKSAIVGLTENSAVELKPLGIRVNCVAPGAVDTDMLAFAAPQLKTSTTPDDISHSIFFLADDQMSSKLTGSVLEVHSNE